MLKELNRIVAVLNKNADEPKDKESLLEKERVAWVFGLTGGELEDTPWAGYAYWYDSAPDYVERELSRKYPNEEFRTVVVWGGGIPPKPEPKLIDSSGRIYTLTGVYSNSGETSCPCKNGDTDPNCPLCEGAGYIYIGEGYESVYRTPEEFEEL